MIEAIILLRLNISLANSIVVGLAKQYGEILRAKAEQDMEVINNRIAERGKLG